MLRWVFLRRGDAVTCGVDRTGDYQFDVSVVRHWDAFASSIERFESAADALERHAALAQGLRDAAWVLIDHEVSGAAMPMRWPSRQLD